MIGLLPVNLQQRPTCVLFRPRLVGFAVIGLVSLFWAFVNAEIVVRWRVLPPPATELGAHLVIYHSLRAIAELLAGVAMLVVLRRLSRRRPGPIRQADGRELLRQSWILSLGLTGCYACYHSAYRAADALCYSGLVASGVASTSALFARVMEPHFLEARADAIAGAMFGAVALMVQRRLARTPAAFAAAHPGDQQDPARSVQSSPSSSLPG